VIAVKISIIPSFISLRPHHAEVAMLAAGGAISKTDRRIRSDGRSNRQQKPVLSEKADINRLIYERMNF
jgi:hypothetical protein